ncbi:MAG TPA: regulatory iron-sulfur-containing complex subunit RicT [Candidatus Aminicenantes bacterium]|nr:regulatory iron-sulfur-containing complex subunit RicT [Candidatus Aminicenantes bacterium]HPS99476.1 regulatory iron-sulfur-containing complex subunit RicT [Candidatus Aminicenantes bacterium]
MPILKIKIDGCCKTLHFTFAEAVPPGEFVLIPSEGGGLLAEVLPESPSVLEHLQDKILPGILKRATVEEVDHFRKKAEREKEAYHFCKERIRIREIPLKLLKVIFFADEKKSIFYFTAEGRVDFRDIVKDLARRYRMRIEMKQIGVRDETKVLGGFGICGNPLCCFSFLKRFEPVTLQRAKDQNININPTKISGVCGRLVCCLNYEEGSSGRLYVDQDEEDLIQYDEELIESDGAPPGVISDK